MRAATRAQCQGLAPYRHWQQEEDIARMRLVAVMGVLPSVRVAGVAAVWAGRPVLWGP